MRRVLFGSAAALCLLAGAALAQQNLTLQTEPQDAPQDAPQVLQEAPPTPAQQTDLGSSIDDLLSSGLPAPRVDAGEDERDAEIETEAEAEAEAEIEAETDAEALPAFGGPAQEEQIAVEISYDRFSNATLRALDKITGRATDIQVQTDMPIVFGSLNIEMKACYQTPPELPPEAAAFLTIRSTQAVQVESMKDAVDASEISTVSEDNPKLFSGWMFASSPGLSALEHPVYDVWVIKCNAA